jgi:tRNA dimethylallyltransferase
VPDSLVPDPLLIVLVGATGSGKTALSLQLAEALDGEIVSCDSVAVYREMELGTAKPSREERARVPHHMIDVVPPSVEYTAGDYGRVARATVAQIAARGHTPIVAGGTGLYLRALLDGFSPMPLRDEPLRDRLRLAVQRRGGAVLHRALRRLDPNAAAAIHENDAPKLIRAIEVSVLAGQPMSDAWQARQPQPLEGFRVVQIGLAPDRAALYTRINARCKAMFADGLVDETATLVAKYGSDCRALNALGYAEAQAVLRGTLSEAGAIAKAQQGHRNYSKRQGTWFRRDTRIQWLQGFGSNVFDEAIALLKHIGQP